MVNIIYVRLHRWTAGSSQRQSSFRKMVQSLSVKTDRETRVFSDRKPHHMLYAFRPRSRKA